MKVIIECNSLGCKLITSNNGKLYQTRNIKIIKDLVNQFTDAEELVGLKNKYILKYSNGNVIIIKGILEIDDLLELQHEVSKKLIINNINYKRLSALFLTSFILVSLNKKIDEVEEPIETEGNIVYETEPKPLFNEEYDFAGRITQTIFLKENNINNDLFPLATKIDDYCINQMIKFINYKGDLLFSYCNDYGVDPYCILSLFMVESSLDHENTLPGESNYNGFAVGIGQIENPSGRILKAYNYDTNSYDSITVNMKNAKDIDKNIKMSIMQFQRVLLKYKGNLKLAFQSYNYGEGLIDLIIQIYADSIDKTKEEIISNQTDIGWMKYIKEVHENPNLFAVKYENYTEYSLTINYLKEWDNGTYGNDKYISRILSYYIGVYSKNVIDNNEVVYNLLDNYEYKRSVKNNIK